MNENEYLKICKIIRETGKYVAYRKMSGYEVIVGETIDLRKTISNLEEMIRESLPKKNFEPTILNAKVGSKHNEK